MEIYNLIASCLGWPIVVALLLAAGGYGYWVLINRIDGLKEKNDYLEMKLSETEKYSPDILVQSLASRLKIISEELGRLYDDFANNKLKITNLESERNYVTQLLAHSFRQIIQSLLSEIAYLKFICKSGNNEDLGKDLDRIENHLNNIGQSLKSGNPTITTTASKVQYGSLSRKNILIVDDDDYFAIRLAELLSTHGVNQLHTAGSIEQALRLMKESKLHFDLILLDMIIPETNENLEAVRAGETQLKEITSILTSAESLENLDAEKINEIREMRSKVLAEEDGLVLDDGGLLFLERLQQSRSKKVKLPPVLFLTAVANIDVKNRARKLVGEDLHWLVKPVIYEEILNEVTKIINQSQSV